MTDTGRKRLPGLDVARGIALVAMAIYHFTWDLEFFGYLDPGTAAQGVWKYFARGIATSFLMLVGIGLALAHEQGLDRQKFVTRFLKIAAAALVITVTTYFATPDTYVFFGILHHIAVLSVVGLLFLGFPWWLLLILAIAIFFGTPFIKSHLFDPPFWAWTGLQTYAPRSNDYVPIFPWLSAGFLGIAIAKSGVLKRISFLIVKPGNLVTKILEWGGRRSLLVYLVHQPILIGIVFLVSQIAPPSDEILTTRFLSQCAVQCSFDRDAQFCERYCACAKNGLVEQNLMRGVMLAGEGTDQTEVQDVVAMCTLKTEREQAELNNGG